MTVLLAIDGGGTRTRCLAVDREGLVRGEGVAGPSNHLQVSAAEAAASIGAAAAAALSQAGAAPADVAIVSAGLAGVDFDGTGRETAQQLIAEAGFARAVVHGDMVIAHRGALAGAPGVVALAGTGSSVLGIAADGAAMKTGGWGPVYGNQGSAWQLAQLGLTAAAEAFDGSGPPTALVARLADALGVSDFRATAGCIYPHGGSQQHVAALAPIVSAAAEEGDEVALAICRRAGADLARAVLAAAARLPARDRRRVSYQGAVLERSRLVREAFRDTLLAGAAAIELHAPVLPPIAGAVLLGAAAAGWRLEAGQLEGVRGV